MDIQIGEKVMCEGLRATVIAYGTMFIDDTWFIEYFDGRQMMVMGEQLTPYEEGTSEIVELETKLASLTATVKSLQPFADDLQHALNDLFGAYYATENTDAVVAAAKDNANEAGRKLLNELHRTKLVRIADER